MIDKKSLLKDVFSPSNLWAFFQFVFPTAAAGVSAALSYIWRLPPSVVIFLAAVTGASVIIMVSEIRKNLVENSVQNKLAIQHIVPLHWFFNPEDAVGIIQLKIVLKNFSNWPIHYYVDVLNFALQGKANTVSERIGSSALIAPAQESSFLLPSIPDLKEGDASGMLRVRVRYGRDKGDLNYRFEAKYLLHCVVFKDEARGMHMMVNHVLEDFINE